MRSPTWVLPSLLVTTLLLPGSPWLRRAANLMGEEWALGRCGGAKAGLVVPCVLSGFEDHHFAICHLLRGPLGHLRKHTSFSLSTKGSRSSTAPSVGSFRGCVTTLRACYQEMGAS